MVTVKLRGNCVEDNGAKRDVEFYDGFDILGDDGRGLFYIRLLTDGSLEIETTLSTVRHGGKLLDDKFIIRPEGSSRIRVTREQYEGWTTPQGG